MMHRRALLAAAPLLAAAAPFQGGSQPGFHRFRLGGFELTIVSDGWIDLAPPHPIFGSNLPAEEIGQALAAARLPTDSLQTDCNCLVVNTGRELVLIDTGSGPSRPFGPTVGRLPDSLRAAGIEPGQIDIVALTHAHPDHAWGILQADGAPLFPNARYAIPATDFDFWTDESRQTAPDPVGGFVRGTRRVLLPVAARTTMLSPGQDVVTGVRSMASPGHSPGHVVYAIESEGGRLLVMGDVANHSVLALGNPERHFAFDADPAVAVATRRRILGQAATDGVPVLGYHFPWPGLGHVEAMGQGFRFLPSPMRWG